MTILLLFLFFSVFVTTSFFININLQKANWFTKATWVLCLEQEGGEEKEAACRSWGHSVRAGHQWPHQVQPSVSVEESGREAPRRHHRSPEFING